MVGYDLSQKNILITGGAGFIGSRLALSIENFYPEASVTVCDKFRSETFFENGNPVAYGDFRNLEKFKGDVVCLDITQEGFKRFLDKNDFDIIFHEAAVSDTTVLDQNYVLNVNLNAFDVILKYAVSKGVKVVYASSGAVYGSSPAPQTIGCEFPSNIYGFSKLKMDHLAEKYRQSHKGFHCTGLRYFNVYGPGEYFKGKTSSMVLQFALQLLKGVAARLFVGSERIFRDFVYVDDIVRLNLLALSAPAGLYNAGTGQSRSFLDIVNILKKSMKIVRQNEEIPNPYTVHYQYHTCADISDTVSALSYTPSVSLEKGILNYLPEIQNIYKKYEKEA